MTRSAYGGPSVLTVAEIATPTPAAHEILVRVHAATVNRTDCAILQAKPFVMRFGTGLRRPKSPVPGTDFAGEVVQTGSGVTEYAAGDRVWGFNDNGLASHAQFLAIAQDAAIAKIPPGIDDAQAAASAEAAHYALNALKRVGYVPGQRVCVYGATGAIGSAAVQLMADQGSDVTAFCRDQHAELVRASAPAPSSTTRPRTSRPTRTVSTWSSMRSARPRSPRASRYSGTADGTSRASSGRTARTCTSHSSRGFAQAPRCTSRSPRVAAAASTT